MDHVFGLGGFRLEFGSEDDELVESDEVSKLTLCVVWFGRR